VSVIVAAYCEEAVIERTLGALLALDYPRREIIIVDDGSTDRTVAILRPYAEDGRAARVGADPHRVRRGLRVPQERDGRRRPVRPRREDLALETERVAADEASLAVGA
jgi:glycosyltransferase involved in cell wall biosynthesis